MKSKLIISLLLCAALLLSLLLYNYAAYGQSFWQRITAPISSVSQSDQLKVVKKKYAAFVRSMGEYRECITGKKACTDEQIARLKQGAVGLAGALIVAAYAYKKYMKKNGAEPEMQELEAMSAGLSKSEAIPGIVITEGPKEYETIPVERQERRGRKKREVGGGVLSRAEKRKYMAELNVQPVASGQELADLTASDIAGGFEAIGQTSLEKIYDLYSNIVNNFPNYDSRNIDALVELLNSLSIAQYRDLNEGEKAAYQDRIRLIGQLSVELDKKYQSALGVPTFDQAATVFENNLAQTNPKIEMRSVYSYLGLSDEQAPLMNQEQIKNQILKREQDPLTGVSKNGRQLLYFFGYEQSRQNPNQYIIANPKAKELYDAWISGDEIGYNALRLTQDQQDQLNNDIGFDSPLFEAKTKIEEIRQALAGR